MEDMDYKRLLSADEYELYLKIALRDRDISRAAKKEAFLRKPYGDLREAQILSKVGIGEGYIAIAVFKQSWSRCGRAPIYDQSQISTLFATVQNSADLRALTF